MDRVKYYCHCGAIYDKVCPTCSQDRGTAAQRGYDYKWQQLRKVYMQENPLCAECYKRGLTRSALDVHHIVPIHDSWAKRLDWNNLISLCRSCHRAKHDKKASF